MTDLLQQSARAFLSIESTPSVARAIEDNGEPYSKPLWDAIADLGWLSVGLSEEMGGTGESVPDLLTVAEELGRAIAPVPWISTAVLARTVLRDQPISDLQDVFVELLEGRTIIAAAIREQDSGYGPPAHCHASYAQGEWTLNGEKHFVVDAGSADRFLVTAWTSAGPTLFLVAASDVAVVRQKTVDGATLGIIRLENAHPEAIIGVVGKGVETLTPALNLATAALTAWMLGASEKSLEMATDYAKVRVQFGRPIGSFQAISHKLADVRWHLDALRVMVDRVADEYDLEQDPTASISVAKAYANRWVIWALHRCHEVFAGLAFMQVHDLQLYYRRVVAAASWLGDEEYHKDEVVRLRVLA